MVRHAPQSSSTSLQTIEGQLRCHLLVQEDVLLSTKFELRSDDEPTEARCSTDLDGPGSGRRAGSALGHHLARAMAVVTPGDVVTREAGYLRGKGVYAAR